MNSSRTARFLLAIWSIALVVFLFTPLASAGNKPPSGGSSHLAAEAAVPIPLPRPIPVAVAVIPVVHPDKIADPAEELRARTVDPAATP